LKSARSCATQTWVALSLVTLEAKFDLASACANFGAYENCEAAAINQKKASRPIARRSLYNLIASTRVPILHSGAQSSALPIVENESCVQAT
jgi:hypothetical protein